MPNAPLFALIAVVTFLAALGIAGAKPESPSRAFADAGSTTAIEWSAQAKSKTKRQTNSARPIQRRIACPRAGCGPVPPGCTAVPERGWDGAPTGFEMIVCRPR